VSEESPHEPDEGTQDESDVDPGEEAWLEPGEGPRIPPSDPRDRESMRFVVATDRLSEVPLTVTVDQGRVAKSYAPADLIAALTDKVQALLRDVGGGFPSMFYGALATQSMTLFFGDPRPEEQQGQLPVEVTLSHARRIAELIDLEDQELFARALEIGLPAQRYTDLAQFVESEGVTLRWTPRGDATRVLSPERASRQHARLIAEPPHDERSVVVNGVLYRVIADRKDSYLGTVGIRLHSWSLRPPARHGVQRRSIIAPYEERSVEEAIKQGLIGESVQAEILIRQPVFGLSIDPEHVELLVASVAVGPTEESRLGMRFDELTDDE
jgi:hypothetical protein